MIPKLPLLSIILPLLPSVTLLNKLDCIATTTFPVGRQLELLVLGVGCEFRSDN